MSSSFIQKRKYTKGYHFDLLAKNQKRAKPVADSHPSFAKQIIPVKNKIVSLNDNPLPDRMENITVKENNMSASVDKDAIVIYKLNGILLDENWVSSNNYVLNEPPKRSTDLILKDISMALVILTLVAFSMILIQPSTLLLPTIELIFRILLILAIFSFAASAAYHYRNRTSKNPQASSPDAAKQVLNRFALAGFLFSLINLLLALITLISFVASGSLYLTFPASFGILVACCAALGLILSIIGFIQIKSNKSKYTGLGLAIFGITFNLFILLMIGWLFLVKQNLVNFIK